MEENDFIKQNYETPYGKPAKKERFGWVKTFLIAFVIIVFMAAAFIGGYMVSGATQSYYYESDNSKFAKIVELIKSQWLYSNEYEDIDQFLDDKAYYGMTSFDDDPYTTYMSPDDLNSFTTSINMDYVGIGVQYSTITELPEITKVFKDSPAEQAGIYPGDIIVGVDGTKIDESNVNNLKTMVLGEEGTTVTITVSRVGQIIDIPVIRGAVDSTVWGEDRDGYAYLEIMSFGEATADDVENYLKDFENKKLVLDLRDDSGGYQTAVETIAGFFIGPNKVYMKQAGVDGVIYDDYTKPSAKQYEFDEIVVLINKNTASAAEVLTICLKEQLDNVILVGTTTYGKGVVQSTYMIEGNSALKLTTSKWLSPVNATWINGVGITPDVEVKLDDVLYMNVRNMDEAETFEYDDCDDVIKACEKMLNYLGYNPGRVDGYFSSDAIKALNAYKTDKLLGNLDVLDYTTYKSLVQSCSYENAFNKDKDYQLNKAIEILKGN